jgi:serine/threonine protein kinase
MALEHVNPLPLAVARRVAVQMIQDIVQLHGKGIIHGDLHRGNVLFCLPGLETWTPEQVNNKLGEPMVVDSDSDSDGDDDTESSVRSDNTFCVARTDGSVEISVYKRVWKEENCIFPCNISVLVLFF